MPVTRRRPGTLPHASRRFHRPTIRRGLTLLAAFLFIAQATVLTAPIAIAASVPVGGGVGYTGWAAGGAP
ncbi:MAG TPA: hypothetical protein VFR93_03320, partial [Candidatus Limnocylindrales bacterium]|nr:hypothetical protein [Candidatus Limnocylindrales bacterium]